MTGFTLSATLCARLGVAEVAAVNKAVSRGGYALAATGLEKCLADGGRDSLDAKKMEKLFRALA